MRRSSAGRRRGAFSGLRTAKQRPIGVGPRPGRQPKEYSGHRRRASRTQPAREGLYLFVGIAVRNADGAEYLEGVTLPIATTSASELPRGRRPLVGSVVGPVVAHGLIGLHDHPCG